MNDRAFPFALRQMQQDFRQPMLWVGLIAAALILALAGAFGTGDAIATLPRVAYWVIVVVVTYAAGDFISTLCRVWFAEWARPIRLGITGVLVGLKVIGILVVLNLALFGTIFDSWSGWVTFAGTIFAVTLIVTVMLDVMFDALRRNAASADPVVRTPALLDRLPIEKRGALVALSVEDHYVRVRTTKAETLTLMRLGDAIKETEPTPGLQTHRSHWVALAAVTRATRNGSTATLQMVVGDDIPVSRSNIAKAKQAGLLP